MKNAEFNPTVPEIAKHFPRFVLGIGAQTWRWHKQLNKLVLQTDEEFGFVAEMISHGRLPAHATPGEYKILQEDENHILIAPDGGSASAVATHLVQAGYELKK